MKDALPLIIAFVISILITYAINSALIKRNRYYVYIMPTIFLILSIIFWISGLLANDWSGLGYLLLAVLSSIIFVGSLLSALYLFFKSQTPN